MAKAGNKRSQHPPLFEKGYAVFVKLWDITSDVPADIARFSFDTLDETLLSLIGNHEERWYPSPYGGSIVVEDVESALEAAKELIHTMSRSWLKISIGITYGHFERVHNVIRWNTAALAMNMAARIASNAQIKGCVAVAPKVAQDAIRAKQGFKQFFGPKQEALVKRTSFEYHLVSVSEYVQPQNISLPNVTTNRKTQSADIIVFDIEKYSEKPQEIQTNLAEGLSKCIEVALSSIGASPDSFGPAGDGGHLAFFSRGGDRAPQSWSFAKELRSQAVKSDIPIRIGISNGPVLKSKYRSVVGGAIIHADEVSSLAPTGGIAVMREFWELLPNQFKSGWKAAMPSDSSSVLVLNEQGEFIQVPPDYQIKSILSDAPRIRVRSVLITIYDKRGIEVPLSYFKEQGIKVIATPNTGTYLKSLGFDYVTTFEYTKCPPISSSRATLHPYILYSISADSNDQETIKELDGFGLDSIDLVFVNSKDIEITEGMTSNALMEQVANVQTGGPSLLRWSLRQWRTSAVVCNPADYSKLIDDLRRNDNYLSPDMRLILLRRAMECLAIKDAKTAELFDALWPQVH